MINHGFSLLIELQSKVIHFLEIEENGPSRTIKTKSGEIVKEVTSDR